MFQPGINIKIKIPLNTASEHGVNCATQSAQPSKVELSEAEKEAKLNKIINDIQHGNIALNEAKIIFEELGIIHKTVKNGNKNILTFEFNGKSYTLHCFADTKLDTKSTKIDVPFTPFNPIDPLNKNLMDNYKNSYTLDELKNDYKLTDRDITVFFEKQNDKYIIRQSAAKSCFGRDDIKTVSQLLEAIKNDGLSEGYVRGAYDFTAEQTNKYLTLISQNPKKYILNQNAIREDFPNIEINTLGQLKDAINNSTVTDEHLGDFEPENFDDITSLNYAELFKSGKMNAEFIEENLGKLILSKDPSVRKFALMINNAFFEYGCHTKKQKQDLIKWFIILVNQQNGIQYPKNQGVLFVGEISVPVTLRDGTSKDIIINITEEDNVRASSKEAAIQYIKEHLAEFIQKWEIENQEEVMRQDNLPQIDIEPESSVAVKKYWSGSFYMRVTLEDGSTKYITIQISVNDKIEAGNKSALENYIREHMYEYLSEWETANHQYIASWDELNCNNMSMGEVYEFTYEKLKKVGLTDWEISTYFQKLNDGTYIMQTNKIDQQFPGMNIRDAEYLKSVLDYSSPTTTNIYLTESEMLELGDNIFDKLEEILNSQKLKNLYEADVDGVIDRFEQGNNDTNDCWLLSGLATISSTQAGKELIKNCVRWNSDYTQVIVTFPGSNESVAITIEELLAADPDLGSGKYNYGDNDVLAIVLAYEKLYGDVDGGHSDTFFDKFLPFLSRDINITSTFEGKGIDDLVNIVGGLFGSGGGRIDLSADTVYEYLQDMLDAKNNGQNVAATFALFTGGDTNYSWTTVDGQEGHAELDHGGWADWGGHVFAITDITSTTVTFVNPWDSSVSYTVTWSEFANIGISEISWATWSNHAPVTG